MPGPVDIGTLPGEAAAGEYGAKALFTARGDMMRRDSAGLPARLALGTSGQLLQSNGTDLVYGSLPAQASMRNNGYYLLPLASQGTRSTATPTKDVTYCYPVFIPSACTVTEIGVEVTTAGVSSLVRLGMFNNGAGAPGTVAAQNTVATTTTGPVAATITVSVSVPVPNWYWFAFVQNTTSGSSVAVLRSIPASSLVGDASYPLAFLAQPTNAGAGSTQTMMTGYSYTGFSNGVVFTDNPSAGEATLNNAALGMMWFKVTVP